MAADNPHPIRLGILKKYLERIAFLDPKCKGLTDLIRGKMEDVVIADQECRAEYLAEIVEAKLLKSMSNKIQESVKHDTELLINGIGKKAELKGIIK